MDDAGGFVGVFLIIALICIVIYCLVMIAGILASIAGAGGVAWGGGTAIVNYGKSFKENMIDSNHAVA